MARSTASLRSSPIATSSRPLWHSSAPSAKCTAPGGGPLVLPGGCAAREPGHDCCMSSQPDAVRTVPIAVTGATGQIGSRVAQRLAAAGVRQRLLVRDPRRAPDLPGADLAVAEYRDGESMRRALAGVDTLLLV